VVERTIDVVTAKVDPASASGSDTNEVDVAYGMTVRVNRNLEVCRAIWEWIWLNVTQMRPTVSFLHRQQTFCWVHVGGRERARGILILTSVSNCKTDDNLKRLTSRTDSK
jgi:hypothetical protein